MLDEWCSRRHGCYRKYIDKNGSLAHVNVANTAHFRFADGRVRDRAVLCRTHYRDRGWGDISGWVQIFDLPPVGRCRRW